MTKTMTIGSVAAAIYTDAKRIAGRLRAMTPMLQALAEQMGIKPGVDPGGQDVLMSAFRLQWLDHCTSARASFLKSLPETMAWEAARERLAEVWKLRDASADTSFNYVDYKVRCLLRDELGIRSREERSDKDRKKKADNVVSADVVEAVAAQDVGDVGNVVSADVVEAVAAQDEAVQEVTADNVVRASQATILAVRQQVAKLLLQLPLVDQGAVIAALWADLPADVRDYVAQQTA